MLIERMCLPKRRVSGGFPSTDTSFELVHLRFVSWWKGTPLRTWRLKSLAKDGVDAQSCRFSCSSWHWCEHRSHSWAIGLIPLFRMPTFIWHWSIRAGQPRFHRWRGNRRPRRNVFSSCIFRGCPSEASTRGGVDTKRCCPEPSANLPIFKTAEKTTT
jgi:hypothetical protein